MSSKRKATTVEQEWFFLEMKVRMAEMLCEVQRLHKKECRQEAGLGVGEGPCRSHCRGLHLLDALPLDYFS